MTHEELQLLLKDICARLPYGIRYKGDGGLGINPYQHTTSLSTILNSEEPLVYLRPLSSMTEEEKFSYHKTQWEYQAEYCEPEYFDGLESYDWLNAHHFDFRGLIEKSLALSAPKGMYES